MEPPPGFEPGTPGSLGTRGQQRGAYEAGALPAELRRRVIPCIEFPVKYE